MSMCNNKLEIKIKNIHTGVVTTYPDNIGLMIPGSVATVLLNPIRTLACCGATSR